MDIDNLTIGEAKALADMFGGKGETNSPHIGKFVLVRTRDAGVHCGVLVSAAGRGCELSDARRIWRWRGANTLNELSRGGAAEDYTRISQPVPSITLTENCEIIPCSDVAAENLRRSRWAK